MWSSALSIASVSVFASTIFLTALIFAGSSINCFLTFKLRFISVASMCMLYYYIHIVKKPRSFYSTQDDEASLAMAFLYRVVFDHVFLIAENVLTNLKIKKTGRNKNIHNLRCARPFSAIQKTWSNTTL